MDEKEDDWDEYIDGASFAINTNISTTTKCSPFFLMYGWQPRLPFEVEKFVEHVEEDDGRIEKLATELSSEDVMREHIDKMSKTRDALFPKIENNIKIVQEKQKQQHLKRKGGLDYSYKNGDLVLRRNMLQKTTKGHKMEDQWTGPYTIEDVNLKAGTCKLRGGKSTLLKRKVNLKDLKMYRSQSIPLQGGTTGGTPQPATPKQPTASQQTLTSQQSQPDGTALLNKKPATPVQGGTAP